MREIEFRGKRIDNSEWIYGWLRQTGHQNIEKSNGQYIKTEKYYQIQDEKYNSQFVDEATIGQYTGLKDKKGNKIYEGDIIKFIYENKEKIRAIVFEKGEFLAKDDTTAFGPTFRHIRLCSNIEVIGNIYDNPEFLKEG